MAGDLEREEGLFEAALEMPSPAERAAFLELECAGDEALRRRIERLLEGHEKAERFFDQCGPALAENIANEGDLSGATDNGQAAPEGAIRQIGPYKLLQQIGEGGCGVVYMAEQQAPVRRRVALKIIKLGMDTRSVIARFEAERQALAMMDHPNIARVLEAGATPTGRPYFVMELVDGVRITRYCDERQLNTRQRLGLFVKVCHAIQHAHQKGIIHRDIKPSNVLITHHDPASAGVPKVIDFGIAKATQEPLTDKTLFTQFGHFIGTPAYMSPEQAERSGLDADTRSDVYSLGVLLYELLTGRTPFDQHELLRSGLDAMRRTLREKEPHRPSAKLQTLSDQELTTTALHRHAEPPRLKSQLRGDLDWIVMKALEKDRARRYQTANALAMDIERHLNNEPVLARPPRRLYRFQRLVRRNRAVFAAVAAVTVTLVIGLAVSTWLFLRERDARQRAVAAEQEQTRLRRAAESRERIAQATVFISRERFAEADELMKGVKIDQPTLEGAAVFRALAEWHVLNSRWAEAASRFETLLRIDQLDGWNIASMDFLGRGASLLALGDFDSFASFREGALARFLNAENPIDAECVLKVCLLSPAPAPVVERLESLMTLAWPKRLMPLVVRSSATDGPQNSSGSTSPSLTTRAAQGTSFDATPPALLGAHSYDGWTIGLQFSEPMALSSLDDLRNYSVAGTLVTNVARGSEGNSVILRLAQRMPNEFTVTATGLTDVTGNLIAPGSTVAGRVLKLQLRDCHSGQQPAIQHEGHLITMTAGGADIYETEDRFGFAYLMARGDFDYRLRVHSLSPAPDPFTRVGIMARDSLESPSSRHVLVAYNAHDSFQVVLRTAAGRTSASLPPNPLPTAFGSNSWVRLQRVGSVFHAYSSNDGLDWLQLYQFDSAPGAEGPFADPVALGIVTCSHSEEITTTAVVSDFGVTPTVPVNTTIALALLAYRKQDYEQAAEWSRRCLAHPEFNAARVATARAVLGLALHHLGSVTAARGQLDQSRDAIERKFQAGLDLGGGSHGFWFDWIFARALLREADALDGLQAEAN